MGRVSTAKKEPLSWRYLHVFGPFSRALVIVGVLVFDDQRLANPLIVCLWRQSVKIALLAEYHDSRHLFLHQISEVHGFLQGNFRANPLYRILVESTAQLLHSDKLYHVKKLKNDLDRRTLPKIALVLQIVSRHWINTNIH